MRIFLKSSEKTIKLCNFTCSKRENAIIILNFGAVLFFFGNNLEIPINIVTILE